MNHRLWVHLLQVPKVGCVVWPVEFVPGSFLPTIEADLKGSHEILASENRVQLVPDDALAEVELGRFEEWRIVPKIRIATPDVERTARLEYARDVSEPIRK